MKWRAVVSFGTSGSLTEHGFETKDAAIEAAKQHAARIRTSRLPYRNDVGYRAEEYAA